MDSIESLKGEALQQFIDRLDKVYYDSTIAICNKAKSHVQKLQDNNPTKSMYASLCTELIGDVEHYITIKKDLLMPYINSLFEKEAIQHDCRSCKGSGTCSLKHTVHLTDLKRSYIVLNDIVTRLQMVVLPLYSDTHCADVHKELRNEIAALENMLRQLLYVEETFLLPKIVAAQKKIHAAG